MKAYLFDMDGTLVNSIDSISYFANNALEKFGLSPIPTERYKLLVGNGAATLVERMLAEVGGSKSLFEPLLEEYNSTYDNNFMYLTRPYDGIIDMLGQLKKDGCKTAVVSNKPHSTAQKISDELFGDLIDVCIGQKDGIPVKPDAAMPNEAVRLLGADKKDCIYVGDTLTDMMTGKNAGLFTVGVLWGFRDIEEIKKGNPAAIISSPKEIFSIDEVSNG